MDASSPAPSGVLPKHPPKQKLPAAEAAGNRHSTGQGPGRLSAQEDAGGRSGLRRRPERPPDAVASFGLFVICIYHPIQPFKHLFRAFGFYDNQRFVDIDFNKGINRAYDALRRNIEKHIGDKAVLAVVDQNRPYIWEAPP